MDPTGRIRNDPGSQLHSDAASGMWFSSSLAAKTLSLKKHTVTVGVGWRKHTQSLGFQYDFDMIWPFSLLGWESKGLQLTTTFRTSRGSNIASSWPIVGAFVYWKMCSPTDNHLRTRWAPTIVTNGVIGPYKWPKIIEVTFFFTLPTHRRKKPYS